MIVLAGMIGAGKTTYAEKIADHLNSQIFYESVDDNPILNDYYQNPKKYAFALQIHFLNTRFQSIKAAYHDDSNVLDRSIYEDILFTQVNVDNGNISQEEFAIYLDLLANMMEELDNLPQKAPKLLVYLSGSFDHILKKIQYRGRPYEQTDGNDYLYQYYQQLFSKYDDWFDNYNYSPKLKLNIEDYDLVNQPEDLAAMLNKIDTKLNEIE
ncbi:deoxynucleoside kinase [Aerococcus sp. YH-aer221]|uniref:Deoxynucleoside kinase n=1 Tax=Aerococcus kribbianus TaxID=2999064 RepID=A0A9X3JGS0_9LACT|nr:deoxynucleoside kinase [Aerococcus sp. YH-aer221]MCZ0725849.1 deoxynucleoside kinase [Aerococcus sp. YH-aer222]